MKLAVLVLTLVLISFFPTPAAASTYYVEQTNFSENIVPMSKYHWDKKEIESCIYKEKGVPNSYYVWTKLAVQGWRQALREYTENNEAWAITARFAKSTSDLESCDLKFYIYDTYKDFPDYPKQTGAYTLVEYDDEGAVSDARVYLSKVVLHGDGQTEIDLPSYAFRNSARHEVGHVFGLGHMESEKGYLMSPRFDFWEENDQMPITTLELSALIELYGDDGFS